MLIGVSAAVLYRSGTFWLGLSQDAVVLTVVVSVGGAAAMLCWSFWSETHGMISPSVADKSTPMELLGVSASVLCGSILS